MRTDLLVVWPVTGEGVGPQARQKVVIEWMLLQGGLDRTLEQGLRQTCAYMERAGSDEGHLVIFDRTGGSEVGREDLPSGGASGRQADHCLGDVTTLRRAGGRTRAPVWP